MARPITILESQAEFRAYRRKNYREFTREVTNHGMYDATFYRQWQDDGEAISRMVQEGRSVTSIPFIKRQVDSMVGSVVADEWEPGFEQEAGETKPLSAFMDELRLEDEQVGLWEGKKMRVVRDGHIYRGATELFIDYTNDPRGRINSRQIQPGFVVYDPDWLTNDPMDCRSIYTFGWMTPDEISDTWGNVIRNDGRSVAALCDELKDVNRWNVQESNSERIIPFDTNPEWRDQIAGRFLVFNRYSLTKRAEKKIWSPMQNRFMDEVPEGQREMFVRMSRLSDPRSMLSYLPIRSVIERVQVGCPALMVDQALEDGDNDIQCGGYHIIPFSCDHVMGHPNTPVDQLKDSNRIFNKRIQSETHILSAASGGAKIMDGSIGTPDQKAAIIKNANNPSWIGEVADGATEKTMIRRVDDRGQYPNDFLNSGKNIMEVAQNYLVPSVPAVAGVGDAGDSGVLFQSRVAQAVISMTIVKFHVREWNERLYSAWFTAAKNWYTFPMCINGSQTNMVYYANIPGGIDIKEVSRLRVSVRERPSSQSKRTLITQNMANILQYAPGNLSKFAFFHIIADNIPDVPDEQRAKLTKAVEMDELAAQLTLQVSIKNMQQQLQQQPSQPQPPPPKVSYNVKVDATNNPEVMKGFESAAGIQPDAASGGAPSTAPSPAPDAPPGHEPLPDASGQPPTTTP